jgi:hypothetical protein
MNLLPILQYIKAFEKNHNISESFKKMKFLNKTVEYFHERAMGKDFLNKL